MLACAKAQANLCRKTKELETFRKTFLNAIVHPADGLTHSPFGLKHTQGSLTKVEGLVQLTSLY